MAEGIIVGLPVRGQMGQEDPPGFDDTIGVGRAEPALEGTIGGKVEFQRVVRRVGKPGIDGEASAVEGPIRSDAAALVYEKWTVLMVIQHPIAA
jgi:hypothetical protein